MTSPSSFPWQPSNPCRGFRKPTSYASSPKRSHPGLLDRERFSESWLRPERRKNRQDSPLAEHGRNKIPKSELYYKIAKRLKNINANSTFGFLSFFNPRHCRGHLIFGSIWATISVRYVHSSFEQYSSLFFQKHAATGQRLLLRKMMGHNIHDRTCHHSAAFPSDHSTCLNLATASKWWNNAGPNSDLRVKLQMARQPEQLL